ncbi:unnamed protein product [Vitrella brassicaformis CCMP3155]|uniref:Uncharacterized protein n=1 Tax=Vitrella brassicaformis (strain CCMP3155) TaxID=1169540 RepID=A0A0G4H4T3_VITBC|nr:unnamed protein product [Vitrella brassicaformis CCMP3155]|eukprot:CEM38801.1 unnamed protein product [Vitrella brassicaformis CCMP3155]
MSDRLVEVFEFGGHFVYEDGHGGYEMDVRGQRVAISHPSFNRDVKFCFKHHQPSVSTKRRRQDDHNGPQQPAAAAAAAGGGGDAASNGNIPDNFMRYPSGAYHKVVQRGTGRVPTLTDTVKFDWISWRDAFDGHNKAYDYRGWVAQPYDNRRVVCRVSDRGALFQEALLSMSVGEVRQILLPAGYFGRYYQLRLISIE